MVEAAARKKTNDSVSSVLEELQDKRSAVKNARAVSQLVQKTELSRQTPTTETLRVRTRGQMILDELFNGQKATGLTSLFSKLDSMTNTSQMGQDIQFDNTDWWEQTRTISLAAKLQVYRDNA